MPRRFSIPFTSNSSTSPTSSEKAQWYGRPTSRSNNRFAFFLSSSPRSKRDSTQSASAALRASQRNLLQISPSPSPSPYCLPSISLSVANSDTGSPMAETQTLFQPPSPAEARRIAKQHAQFGPISAPSHRYSSHHRGEELPDPVNDDPPYFILLTTYLSYLILIIVGHVRDFFGKVFTPDNYRHLQPRNGYAPLYSDFDNFYVRRLQLRLADCFARVTTGVPGRFITLLDRYSEDENTTFKYQDTTTETLNMSSYNYLGFAQSEGPCADVAEEILRKNGLSMMSPRVLAGTSDLHIEVEDLVAKFVGKESSMVFSMGFGTNATVFPALVGKGCLLISDELNHSSIRFGARLSGASIAMFKHNNMADLERLLRESISQGQPRTHRPWKKIIVVAEGLYSMEGTMCNLPGLVALRRRYKFYLYIDEAHSIGATGPRGRGVCDYFGIDTSEVDILMGTLTKSFGANGGYIAANKSIIDKLRSTNAGYLFSEAVAPAVLAQIATSLRLIAGEVVPGQGEERLQRLTFNSRYLRLGLKRLGYIVYGHDDSPIVPVLLYHPGKMPAFSHEMLRRQISVVVVGYPATPLITSRARFCVSAAHNKDDLDRLLAACDEIGTGLMLKTSSGVAGGAIPADMRREMEDEDEGLMKGRGGGAEAESTAIEPPRWKLEDVVRRGVQDTKVPLI